LKHTLYADFFVAGDPKPKGSVNAFKGRYAIPASKGLPAWEKAIKKVAVEYASQHNIVPEAGVFSACLYFQLRRPKKYKSNNLSFIPHATAPDSDKLARGIFDSLSKVLFEDDRMIYKLLATKRVCYPDEVPGVRIRLYRCTPD
jgi:Holliday junction resolvase RusA-like endonuclease